MPTAESALVLDVGARTDVGLRRAANEDSLLVGAPLYVVADGMGGHAAGDLASQAVIAGLRPLVGADDLSVDALLAALADAQYSVRIIADANERGAGSTVTGIASVVHDGAPHWIVFNVGDSRVYRQRGGMLAQLTVDHSLAQELVDSGALLPADVPDYRGRNVITRAVGADHSEPDHWLYPVQTGERLVLCSDGLSGELSDPAINRVLSAASTAQQAADALVERALTNGGRDNVTVIVVDVLSGGARTAPAEAVAAPADDAEYDIDEDTLETPGRAPRDR
jgi:serine/threonine protein phosphatase PrpC